MASARPDRAGPQFGVARHFAVRSLSGRMLLLMLLPLVLAQFLVFRDLGRSRAGAKDAAALASRIGLMSMVGAVYAPAAFEEMTSLGLAYVDRLGADRSIIKATTGIDYEPILSPTRVELEHALASLEVGYGRTVLQNGRTVTERLADVRTRLTGERTALDEHRGDGAQISAVMAAILSVADELAATADVRRIATADASVDLVQEQAFQLLSIAQAVTTWTRTTSAAIGPPNASLRPTDAPATVGVADFTVSRYGRLAIAEPAVAAQWKQLMASEAIIAYNRLRPKIAAAFALRAQSDLASAATGTTPLVTDPAFVHDLADMLQASFERLRAIEHFGAMRFAGLTADATAIGRQADSVVGNWMLLLILVTTLSIALLALMLWTTVRRLRRLRPCAPDVGRVENLTHPLRVSGPSDVRAVTVTFNSMVATFRSFEAQLRGLASGEAPPSSGSVEVPGSLDELLRKSVQHLSEVTTRLRESEALATAIIDTATDAIWTVDESGTVLSANAAGERLLGFSAQGQIGRSLPDLFGGRAEVVQLSGELDFRRADGSAGHALISQSEGWVEGRLIHVVFAKDVSERKRFEARLAFQARHDMLTGLPNRLAAIEHLDRALERTKRLRRSVGVLFIDLDGFKAINDSRGHAKGDELLREVGTRLRDGLRDSEFVGRLGGDEFLIVAEGLDLDQLEALGGRLMEALSEPIVTDDDVYVVSACVGASSTDVEIDGLELIRQADAAVYQAKSRGRGRVVTFDEALQKAIEANAETEQALHAALGGNELELYFQPIVDLRTRRAWGAEALVRWNRPGHGQILPDRFIPVAERSSLIIDLGRWVITNGLQTLAEWQHDPERQHLNLAVNISGRHLTEGDLVEDLQLALLATGADPTKLEVELTETHLLADFERANSVLRCLREWGIKVSVDDFGTGYSSMSYLRQLQIDTIKIDRVFVDRIQNVGYDRTIVEVLLQLAAALDLDVVAEGVETAEQLAFLEARNCGRVQGFFLAQPMSRQQIDSWLGLWELEANARS